MVAKFGMFAGLVLVIGGVVMQSMIVLFFGIVFVILFGLAGLSMKTTYYDETQNGTEETPQ
jgi:hypothetical protein